MIFPVHMHIGAAGERSGLNGQFSGTASTPQVSNPAGNTHLPVIEGTNKSIDTGHNSGHLCRSLHTISIVHA